MLLPVEQKNAVFASKRIGRSGMKEKILKIEKM
jgi:hypothetical protein